MSGLDSYVRLSRLHRPRAIFLILWPCWWGLALVGSFDLKLYILFSLGALLMRGAGCTFNDWADQDFDREVVRTKMRPLATKELSTRQAFKFFGFQSLGGLIILLCLPPRCWILGIVGLGLLFLYPFMKRLTNWPQLVLGFAFNFGIIMSVVAVLPYESISWIPVLSLYAAGIAWTLGYDTIYALQDKDDDQRIGIKSTALFFGKQVKFALYITYAIMFGFLAYIGYWVHANFIYDGLLMMGVLAVSIKLFHLNIDDVEDCLATFNANVYLGGLVWVALLTLKVQ